VLPLAIAQDLIDFLPWFVAASSLVALTFLIFRSFPPRPTVKPEKPRPIRHHIPASVGSSITDMELEKARNELKTLRLERDIASYALTKLFEAGAQGTISQEERDRLISKYREDMKRLERSIGERELVVSLHELENIQSNLLGMFQKRFDEISSRIEEIRSQLGIESKEPPETLVESIPEESEKKTIETAPKTPVEDIIKEIREEVQRELEKMEQMEVEEANYELDRAGKAEGSD
jgi:hypothetical protein